MDIPLVGTAPARAPAAIAPVMATQVSATAQAQAAAAVLAQTTVDLSPLGRFLSAVTLFQKRLVELQANPAAVAAQADSDDAFAAVASSVVALSEGANALQTSLINGTSDDQSLATLFNQQFAAQTDSVDEGDSDSLAAIGLTFTPGLGGEDVLEVDSTVLQAAFAADPQGTAALLARTAAAFGALSGVAADAGAEPSVLFANESNAPGTGAPAPASAPGLPALADAPAPISSDGALLQELLAETPRPALALSQAPPPAVAEASATFAAERAAEALVQPASARSPDNATAALLPPLRNAAPAVAANLTSAQQADEQAAAAQAARLLANQSNASRIEARGADNRMVDKVATERDANERIAGAVAANRVAQASELETQNINAAAVSRAGGVAIEQRRLDDDGITSRLERPLAARVPTPAGADATMLLRDRVAATLSQPMPPADNAPAVVLQQLQPLPVNNAQQLARDPAIAAAIAAYNLNAGPFAALNGRPEIAAQRPKLIPAVHSVTSVEAIETDAATSDSSRPFR